MGFGESIYPHRLILELLNLGVQYDCMPGLALISLPGGLFWIPQRLMSLGYFHEDRHRHAQMEKCYILHVHLS